MNITEQRIQELFTKLGCDETLISSLQREIFGNPEESGTLAECYKYALNRVKTYEPTLAPQFINNKAERFSADWGHTRYELMRSDSDRISAMYRIVLDLSVWSGHAGYFNDQLTILAKHMNEMSENRPAITFRDTKSGEQYRIDDPEEAHERFGELLDYCSEIIVSYTKNPEFT